MQFNNTDSWKAYMKKYAKMHGLDIQEVQLRFVLEEFAILISRSEYKDHFVFKGGFIVSTLLGIETRMTRDIDVTFKNTLFSKSEIIEIINHIIKNNTHTFFTYTLRNLRETQLDDRYTGYTAYISACKDNTEIIFKIDISNNVLIYPDAILTELNSIFTNTKINISSYHIETIIAEKFETTLDRGEYNSRMRDLIDIYLLLHYNKILIDYDLLSKSIINISKDRNTFFRIEQYEEIKTNLLQSSIYNRSFKKYIEIQYPHLNIDLNDIFQEFDYIMEFLDTHIKKNLLN